MNNIIKRTDNAPKTLGSVVDQLFHSNLNRFFDDQFWGFNGVQSQGRVPVNIRETASSLELEVIAPGLKKEDFNLSCNNELLTISFEHKEEKADTQDNTWIRKEYRSGSFTRSFQVDNTLDIDKAQARYENGILFLTLPKKEEAKRISRTIDVQ